MVLVGASLNVTGRSGAAALYAIVAGLLALAAGALNRSWQGSVPLGGAAVILTLVSVQFNLQDPNLLLQVAGLLLLGLGGIVGSIAYRSLSDAIRRHVDDLQGLDAGPRGLDSEKARGLATLHATPELLFRRQK